MIIAILCEGVFFGQKVTPINPCNLKQDPLVDFVGVCVEAFQEFLNSVEKLSPLLLLGLLLFVFFFVFLLSLILFNISVLDRVPVKEISGAALAWQKHNLVEQGGDPIQSHNLIQVLLLHEALPRHDKLLVSVQFLAAPVRSPLTAGARKEAKVLSPNVEEEEGPATISKGEPILKIVAELLLITVAWVGVGVNCYTTLL